MPDEQTVRLLGSQRGLKSIRSLWTPYKIIYGVYTVTYLTLSDSMQPHKRQGNQIW